jgi:hypothetical protein
MAQKKFNPKLSTIFHAEVADYSRLTGDDEAATVKHCGVLLNIDHQENGYVQKNHSCFQI